MARPGVDQTKMFTLNLHRVQCKRNVQFTQVADDIIRWGASDVSPYTQGKIQLGVLQTEYSGYYKWRLHVERGKTHSSSSRCFLFDINNFVVLSFHRN